MTYEAQNLPPGLAIDVGTGMITGTIAYSAAAGSPYSVADGAGTRLTVDATDTFTWTVETSNREPTFNQDRGAQDNVETDVVSVDAGATDPDGDPLTYEAQNLPPGLAIDVGTGMITGTIAYSAAAGSPYSVSLTVRDGLTVDATDTFTWTVGTPTGSRPSTRIWVPRTTSRLMWSALMRAPPIRTATR